MISKDSPYSVTPAGNQELTAGSTSLSPMELEILVRCDGTHTPETIQQDMRAHPAAAFDAAFASLVRKHLLAHVELDPFELQMVEDLQRMGTALGAGELSCGLLSLTRKGYYVRIARQRESSPATGEGQPRFAVLIEDDPMLTRFLQSYLTMDGFTVRSATNRAEVLATLRQQPLPEVVLLDLGLPDVSGFNILYSLKQHQVLSRVPVVVLTAADTRESVIKALTTGAEGYLTKPVDPDSLMRAVHAVLGLAQAEKPSDVWAMGRRPDRPS